MQRDCAWISILMIRTHWTLPRALHDERGTCGDQDGHLLVQHVPRPLRPRPVRGHHDRLRGEGLEDISGKSAAKMLLKEKRSINPTTHFRSTPRCRFSASYSFTSSRPSPLVGSSRTSGMERRGTSSRRLPRSTRSTFQRKCSRYQV